MVKECIVFGHKVSGKGIEFDRAKVEAIERMPPPRDIKDYAETGSHNSKCSSHIPSTGHQPYGKEF